VGARGLQLEDSELGEAPGPEDSDWKRTAGARKVWCSSTAVKSFRTTPACIRSWYAALLFFVAAASTHAAEGNPLALGERTRDVGRIIPLARLQWVVTLTNGTTQPVEIRNVRTSCSCLIPPWRTQVVPAGSQLAMPLELIASSVSGPFVEQLEFDASHPEEAKVRLEIRGEVYQPVEAVPAFAMLPITPDAWKDEVAVARIVNHESTPIEVSGLKSLHPSFVGRLVTVRPGFEYALEMRVTKALPNGNHYGGFELATSSTNVPRLEVTAFVPGLPAVAVGPRVLRLPTNPGPNTTSAPVYIRSTTPHVLEVRHNSPPPTGTRVLLETVEKGRLYRLSLVTEVDLRSAEGSDLALVLESNHPSHRTLRVPISFADSETNAAPVNAGP
jgi:Protein of unknown function (DUF1573)